jgi:N-acetylneuraminic acid mutarotase
MKTARAAYGCVVDNYGAKIYVVGGTSHKMQPLASCEVYSIAEDRWTDLKSLKEPRFSQSLVVFNDIWLYQFGGFKKNPNSTDLVNTIEKLNLEKPKADWTQINVTLPAGISTIGGFALDLSRIVIFGGWSQENQKNAYLMTETKDKWVLTELDPLQGEDIFLYNGCLRREGSEVTFCGSHYMHTFSEEGREFEIRLKLK